MRYILIVSLMVFGCLFLCGCDKLTKEQIQEIKDSSLLLDTFVEKMGKGETTRDDEQVRLRSIAQRMRLLREAIESREKRVEEVKKAEEEAKKTEEKKSEPKKIEIKKPAIEIKKSEENPKEVKP